jgi:hypothetical protein
MRIVMSGRRIDDHSVWVGSKPKGTVFPEHAKMKEEHSAEGDGHLSKYEDTTEAIHSVQKMAKGKASGHSQKPGYRY